MSVPRTIPISTELSLMPRSPKRRVLLTVSATLMSLFACAVLVRKASMEAVRFESNAPAKINKSSPGLPKSLQPIVQNYLQLPIAFEANQGQTDAQVKFMSRGPGYNLYLTASEAVLTFRTGKAKTLKNPAAKRNFGEAVDPRGLVDTQPDPAERSTVRMKLAGANEKTKVAGIEQQSARVNYFIGNDPAKWQPGVPTYARVQYQDVYRGVDLIYHCEQQQLEYDFVVKPGADPNQLRLRFRGAKKIRIDESGDLVLTTKRGEVRQHKPVVYQEVAGGRKEISGSYILKANREISFEIGRYDNSQSLVIDPVLSYSTYLGGPSNDNGLAIAVDSPGNAYVTGRIAGDAFAAKLTASGGLDYLTYLGGNNSDVGQGIAVDSTGNAYLTGQTRSTDFPTLNAYQTNNGGSFDAFVTKLTTSGELSYSTYLGGNNEDSGYGIAVDSASNAYLTGLTLSGNFPVLNAQPSLGGGGPDAFATRLTASGGLSYSTYLGGNGDDTGQGIAVDSSGNAYVTGYTTSTSFPTRNASQGGKGGGTYDAFVTKLTSSAELSYSTYLGGNGDDLGQGIAVDSSGNAYVTGLTVSSNFPILNAFQPTSGHSADAFVTKLTAGGGLGYSTYLGGNDYDYGLGIAVDSAGSAYVTGLAFSTNFPTKHAAQANNGGGGDAFVTKLTASGALSYSTYLGGSDSDKGYGIGIDSAGNACITGDTFSTDFPTPNASQAIYVGGGDVFITKLSVACASNLEISGTVPDFCATNSQPINLTLNGTGLADSDITWSLSGPSPNPNLGSGANLNITLSGLTPGNYVISATATNTDCPDTLASQNFEVGAVIAAQAGPDQAFCGTASTTLAGNTPSPGTGAWTLVSGAGTITDPADPTSGVTDLGYGNNSFRWTITNGSCSSSDDVVITRSPCPTNITLFSNRDSFTRSGADDTNEGANERLRIQNSGNNRAVVAFDLTGVSTVGLQSATLILNIAENSNNWGSTGRLVDAQRLLVDWTEGNGRNDVMVGGGPGFRGSGSGVTWHCAVDTNIFNQVANCSPLWNGGSFAAATGPSVLHTNGLLGQVSWDVTADVLAGANFGWVIRKQNENQNGQVRYYSREGAILAGNANLAPQLVLVYSTPPPASGSHAYVANYNSDDISVINTATNTLVATVPVGDTAHAVALNPDASRAYVANFGGNSVSVIDTATNAVVATVPVGTSPRDVAVSPSGSRVYVANYTSTNVSVIDTATNTVVATVPLTGGCVGVAINATGTRAYVAYYSAGNVSVIDTATNTVVATVLVAGGSTAIAINPSGTRLYVPNQSSDIVSVVDTATNTVVATVSVGLVPYGVAFNPSGTRAYVANNHGNNVSVIDTATLSVVATVPVGLGPFAVAVNKDGTRAYVTNFEGNNLSVIDTATNNVVATVTVGTNPSGVAVK